MDGHERAGEAEHVAHLRQRRVRTLPDDGDHAAPVSVRDLRLPPRPVVQGTDLADVAALLDQLLHHAQRDAETLCDLLAGVLSLIVTGQYPLADVEG